MKQGSEEKENWEMGKYSFRNFDIGNEFLKKFKECAKSQEQFKCESKVRKEYRNVESSRLKEMADKIHSFISHLDPDEVKSFKEKFSDTTKIANEFAVVEELREF